METSLFKWLSQNRVNRQIGSDSIPVQQSNDPCIALSLHGKVLNHHHHHQGINVGDHVNGHFHLNDSGAPLVPTEAQQVVDRLGNLPLPSAASSCLLLCLHLTPSVSVCFPLPPSNSFLTLSTSASFYLSHSSSSSLYFLQQPPSNSLSRCLTDLYRPKDVGQGEGEGKSRRFNPVFIYEACL